jgi:hypothetical protein
MALNQPVSQTMLPLFNPDNPEITCSGTIPVVGFLFTNFSRSEFWVGLFSKVWTTLHVERFLVYQF